jgi:L-lactate dehydrogenase complex protein LldE
MTVQIFIPCFIDQLYPQTAFNMIKLLKKAGCKVEYNTEQTCCGQPCIQCRVQRGVKGSVLKIYQRFQGR